MGQIRIGRILPIFKGNWDGSTTYYKLDIVYYNGSSYVAKTQNTNQVPTNTFYWQIVAKASTWTDFTDAEKEALVDYCIDVLEQSLDSIPTKNSTNFVNSSGVYTQKKNALENTNILCWIGQGWGFNTSTGIINSGAGVNRNVTELKKIEYVSAIKNTASSPQYYVAYYNSSKTFISADGWKTSRIYDLQTSKPSTAVYFSYMIDLTRCEPDDVSVITPTDALATELDGDVTTLETNLTSLSGTVGTINTNLQSLTTEVGTINSEISDISDTVDLIDNQLQDVDERTTTNTSNISSLQSGQSTLQSRVTTAEGNITSLDHGLSTLENNINTLNGRVTTNTSNITALQSSVATNTNDIASLKEEADNYDLVNTNRGDFELSDNDGNVLLRLANGHIITKNFNSSNASPDLAQAVATNTSNISSLQSSVATNTNDIATLQTNTTTNTNNIATLQSSVTTNTNNIATLQSSVTTNTNNINSLQSESIPLYANLPTRYDSSGNKIIKILGIGNSWTVDYTEYLPRVLENAGYTVTIGVFYRGGAFLEDVYKCMTGTLAWGYSLLYETSTGHWTTSSSTDYLYTYTDWDVIILNEGTTANSYSTYQPYLNNIIDLLFTKLTHPVKIGLSVVESKNDGDTEAVWRGIVNASISAYNDSYLDFLIPVGTTAQNYRNCTTLMNALVNSTYGSDVLYTSSGQHLREGLPILSASYTLAMSLAGIGIWSDSTVPNASLISSLQIPSLQQHAAPIASDSVASNRMLVQKCVKNAFKNWTKITSI